VNELDFRSRIFLFVFDGSTSFLLALILGLELLVPLRSAANKPHFLSSLFIKSKIMPLVSSSTSGNTAEPVVVASVTTEDANQVISDPQPQAVQAQPVYAVPIQAPVQVSPAVVVAPQQQSVVKNGDQKFIGAPMGTAATKYHEPKKTSGKAVASLICAILGLFVLGIILGPVAICLAVAAKNDIKAKPDQLTGKCMATSGLIIGIIGFVLSIIILVMIYG
jgi:Domain of unknown function (DUF4190)